MPLMSNAMTLEVVLGILLFVMDEVVVHMEMMNRIAVSTVYVYTHNLRLCIHIIIG